jgi:hypothetical protein
MPRKVSPAFPRAFLFPFFLHWCIVITNAIFIQASGCWINENQLQGEEYPELTTRIRYYNHGGGGIWKKGPLFLPFHLALFY